MAQLSEKCAIVTGGAKGIGAAIATAFTREGAQVMLVDLDTSAGAARASELGALFHEADVGDESAWQNIAARAQESWGKVDILVNNAGIMEPGSVESVTAEVHHRTMRVHVDGTLWACKHTLPLIEKAGGGSIINIASIASLRGVAHVVSYCAAKGAIESMTRSIADHCKLKNNRVRCNSIHPAGMDTPMIEQFFDGLGMGGESGGYSLASPEHVAQAAVYLASDAGSFMSGQRLVVDNEINQLPGFLLEG